MNIDDLFIDLFQKQIPFELTASQKKCIEEIYNDITKTSPMKRLLQGDVGSGKTIVAAAAVTATIKNNKQAALMAPTEVLAEQHLTSFKKYLEYFDVDIHLLTSSVKDLSLIHI